MQRIRFKLTLEQAHRLATEGLKTIDLHEQLGVEQVNISEMLAALADEHGAEVECEVIESEEGGDPHTASVVFAGTYPQCLAYMGVDRWRGND